jgi:hypothetical protein
METETERHIGFVIRILRYIGWPFAVLFVGMTALSVLLSPALAFAKGGSIGMAIVPTAALIPFAAFFVWVLRVAKRMSQRDPTANSPATNLSSLLVPGFPLFTIVGVMCLLKIRRFYDAYCAEQCSTR